MLYSLSNIIDLDKVSLTFYLCAQLFYVIEFLFLQSKEKRSGASLLSKKIVGSYNNETKMVSLHADVERQPEQVHNVASAHNEAEASRGTYSSAFKLGQVKDVFQLLLYNFILSSYLFIFQLLQVINMSSHTLPSSFFECVRRFAG